MTAPDAVVNRLRAEHERVLAALIEESPLVALLDYPNHANVGDSAIWLGETDFLAERGARVVYVCDVETYDERALRARIGNGVILLHGGGNLGDLWPRHQELRERVVADFPDSEIIQLPQTIHFSDPAVAERAGRVFDRHLDFTLLVRDTLSMAAAREYFPRTKTLLCPDSAFRLSAPCPSMRGQGVLYIGRTDLERRHAVPAGVATADWITFEPARPRWQRMLAAMCARHESLFRQVTEHPADEGLIEQLARAYDPVARQQVARGFEMLQGARVIVSDRLHVHILSLLSGTPHVLLDNSYGKVRSFYDTWTSDANTTHWADDADQAVAMARGLPIPVAHGRRSTTRRSSSANRTR